MSIQQNFVNIKPSLNLDFANTKQLDPRITFARASTARFYDGKTTAKAEENLLLQSQDFDNAAWTKSNSTVTANSTTAPDGTTTAETLTVTSLALNTGVFQSRGVTTSGVTLSVFAKANTSNFIGIAPHSQNLACYANFNLSTGAVASSAGCTASIVSVGNGWYRCTLANSTLTGDGFVTISVKNSDPAANPWNNGIALIGDSIFLWGAQLEQRSFATAYTPTTSQPITNYIPVLQTAAAGTPRFDHNPVTGESLGLLIEEQRTNLLNYSEQFDNAAWTKSNATITANSVVAPNGTTTADTFVSAATTGASSGANQGVAGTVAAYTFSIYAKAGTVNFLRLALTSNTVAANAWFNLATGVVGTVESGVTASITAAGNGWYRCSVTRTLAAVSETCFVRLSDLDNSLSAPSGSTLSTWGAQLEAGAFATSYIPTVASQVTRAADSAGITGSNFSSWYRASEGTIYSEFSTTATGVAGVFALNEGAGFQTIDYRAATGFSTVFAAGATQASLSLGAANSGAATKIATAYAVNDYVGTRNGGAIVSDTSVILPVGVNTLRIGSIDSDTNKINGNIRKIAYYPIRATNTQLQALTS